MTPRATGDLQNLERSEGNDPDRYVLLLYITGMTRRSALAIANVRAICEAHLRGRYDIEVIDLYEQPLLAKGDQILAAPTLIKKLPQPLRRIIGDMSNTERVLVGLDLRPVGRKAPGA